MHVDQIIINWDVNVYFYCIYRPAPLSIKRLENTANVNRSLRLVEKD